jgi:homospermidine synthase
LALAASRLSTEILGVEEIVEGVDELGVLI